MKSSSMTIAVPLAEFVKSATAPRDFPSENAPEIAFVGRSNVGKSSLINTLVQRRGLVRISSTPGCTRLVNFFRLEVMVDTAQEKRANYSFSLVDLPGFGYAKIAKEERSTWRAMIESYFSSRKLLRAVVIIVDGRRGAEDEEKKLIPWLASLGATVILVMTKTDKLAKHERQPLAAALARELGMSPIIFSSQTGEGRIELWQRLLKATAAE